jgi:hypothetical protein
MRITTLAAIAACTILAGAAARAEVVHFTAKLDGAAETPPKVTDGRGAAEVTLDTTTRRLSWTIDYSGLTGPATMAHFHGPAAPGVAAGVTVPITGPMASPLTGTASLNDGQIGDLLAGLWYVNIHTAKYPGGEIRGQVVKTP